MRILEIETDFLMEASWFQWHECSENMLESIKSISSQDMDYNDFCGWFEELTESQQTKLLIDFVVYEINGWVYFVDDKKFRGGKL